MRRNEPAACAVIPNPKPYTLNPTPSLMILSCCKDLIFATKIRSTAEHVGVPYRAAGNVAAVLDRLNRVADGRLNEPVTGVLIDLEMGDTALAIIDAIRQHTPGQASAGGVPIVAFGSHVAVDVLTAAREKGADAVMPRSQFVVQLPELLKRFGGAEL